jgi:hypothetical protein
LTPIKSDRREVFKVLNIAGYATTKADGFRHRWLLKPSAFVVA